MGSLPRGIPKELEYQENVKSHYGLLSMKAFLPNRKLFQGDNQVDSAFASASRK